MLLPFVTALVKLLPPQQSLYLNVWCRHWIHVVLALLYSVQAPWSSTSSLILLEYPTPWDPSIQLPCAQTYTSESFCEFIHHLCQKYVSMGYPGKGECGNMTEASNETTPHQVQKKQTESNYGTRCHGVVWMPNTALPCLPVDKVRRQKPVTQCLLKQAENSGWWSLWVADHWRLT